MFIKNEKNEGVLDQVVYEQLINFLPKEQKSIDDEDALNAIIYGIECYEVKDESLYNAKIFVSPLTSSELYFINIEEKDIRKINLNQIVNVTFRKLSMFSRMITSLINSENACQILVKKKLYNLGFKNLYQLLLFVKGLILVGNENISTQNPYVHINLNKYNDNFNDVIEDEELKNLASSFGINEHILKTKIDTNKDNVVSISELKSYIKEHLSGEQFRPIFEKYATLKLNNEHLMGPVDLQNFFREEQKEEISFLESCQIIIQFNPSNNLDKKKDVINSFENIITRKKNINSDEITNIINKANNNNNGTNEKYNIRIYLTLYEFNMMLHSLLLTVYNYNIINKELDLDHPLVDYFINSTHNTYLTSHQLIGKSSVDMYTISLLFNFRLVELDCYNGEGDQIIITHGFTFVTDLLLDEILYELKENAFINSNLPVILSIENHLDEYHQMVMVKKLKEILVDLYIFPFETKPQYIPTLRELCNKFIIKCGGRRLWETANYPKKALTFKKKNLEMEKKIIFLNGKAKNFDFAKKENNNNKRLSIVRSRSSINFPNQNDNKLISYLENIRGILSAKYDEEKINLNYYKPWEMITLKSSKVVHFSENPFMKRAILNLTSNCMIKVYPEKFNSTNYNIIKCFSIGCQSCALNVQTTDDDFVLYNKIFFKQNQGLGYVLKSDILTPNNFNTPTHLCKFEILSMVNFSQLIEVENLNYKFQNDLKMEIYVIGVAEDERNTKYKFELINGSVFPYFKNGKPNIEYKVYNYDLSAIMIKIIYNEKMIGRSCIPYFLMKQGFRRIPIYDNSCFNVKEAYLVGKFNIQKL